MPHSLQKMCTRLCKHACATEQLLVCPGHGNHYDPSWNLSSAQKNHQNSRQLMTQLRLSCLTGCDHPVWRWCRTHLASQGLVLAVRNGCNPTQIQFSLIFWRKLLRWFDVATLQTSFSGEGLYARVWYDPWKLTNLACWDLIARGYRMNVTYI